MRDMDLRGGLEIRGTQMVRKFAYLGIETEDALAISEQIDLRPLRQVHQQADLPHIRRAASRWVPFVGEERA
jgi:hypothetical protein